MAVVTKKSTYKSTNIKSLKRHLDRGEIHRYPVYTFAGRRFTKRDRPGPSWN